MSARPRVQHPPAGALAPMAPTMAPSTDHSPYLKAVLTAGYAQHQARQAQLAPMDAPVVENPEQDIGPWYDNLGKSRKGKGSWYQQGKARLSRMREGATQAADDLRQGAGRAAKTPQRLLADEMDELRKEMAELTPGSDAYEQKLRRLYALLTIAEAM